MENQAELTRMMQTYGTQLLRLCTLYLKDRMLAEDAVQETFVRAWRADFRQECSEKTFLTRIAINICKNYLRPGTPGVLQPNCLTSSRRRFQTSTTRSCGQCCPCRRRTVR